ncbi:MAG: AAA family ATPase [Sphingomonadales bacterium]|nr:AAA family ATPase [Sphingomonadales bacterium]
MDREITLTRFNDAGARRAFRHLVPLRGLAPKIVERRAERKDRLPWLKLATFGDVPSRKGSLRHNGNVTAIDGIEGDHDAGTVTPAEAAQRLQQAGIAALIYTSPSHTPERPRWRVLAPLSRSMSPEHRERLCARLQGVLGGALAPESFALSQSYYYGGVEGGTVPETLEIDGAGIDTLDRLDAGALDKRGKPYAAIDPDHFMFVPPALLEAPENDGDDLDIWPTPNLDKIRGALAALPAEVRDDRDQWLRVGMALHHAFRGGEEGFDLWNDWSKDSPEHGKQRDQREDWASFGGEGGKPVTIATLYAMAKEKGWNAKVAAPREPSRLVEYTTEDCLNAPPRGYVIKRLIAPGDVGCIFGAPGGGKSTIAPYLGYHVARGESVFGLRTKPGKVLYVAPEDTHGMRRRVAALVGQMGHEPDFRVIGGVSDLLDDDSPDLAALLELIDSRRPSLIFLDTLAMSFRELEENDAAAMNKVVAIARSLTVHGAAVVMIHHGTKAEGSTPRGHSVLNGALDVAVQLLPPDSDGIIRGRLSKNRNGPCDLDIAFRVASEELGRDEDGDAETAAVAAPLAPGSVPRGKPMPRAQREALTILQELEAGDAPVAEEAWRDACIESRRVSQSDERDSRKRTFNIARNKLFDAGRITISDDGRVAVKPLQSWVDDEEDDQ